MSHPRQLNAKNNLTEAPSPSESNYVKIISVRGSVVDVCFEQELPAIYCFVVSMILIFANSFWNHFIAQ